MSLALWFWRIFYMGGHGSVVRARKHEPLEAPPVIPGVEDIEEIDYAPGCCCLIRHAHGRLEEMTAEEIKACNKWLGWPGPIRIEVR